MAAQPSCVSTTPPSLVSSANLLRVTRPRVGIGSSKEGRRVQLPPEARSLKIALKPLCHFSFVKPLHQEHRSAIKGADHAFTARLRLMGSAQPRCCAPKPADAQRRCLGAATQSPRCLPAGMVRQHLRSLTSVEEVPLDGWVLFQSPVKLWTNWSCSRAQ